ERIRDFHVTGVQTCALPILLSPLARLVFRPKVIGRRNVPKRGGVLIASNHLAFIDSIVLTLVARRSVSFMAKSAYFTGRGLKGRSEERRVGQERRGAVGPCR